jgi:tetratricopeptide (TPR) repeat protein
MRFLSAVIILYFLSIAYAQETGDYIHYRLGVKYKNENNYDLAIEEFRKSLAAYPDNYNAYMQLAEIRKSQNNPRLEIYSLKKALVYNPGWGKAHKMLADAYEADKQLQNAIMEMQIYQQACDPSERDSVQKCIDKLVRKVQGNDREPPAKAGDPVVASEPVSADSLTHHASADSAPTLRKTANVPAMVTVKKPRTNAAGPEAQPHAARAVPTSDDVELKKVISLYEQGKIDEAVPLIKKMIQERPGSAAAYYYGGLLRYKQGKFDMAKTNFMKSMSYPEAGIFAHYYLGKIFSIEKYFRGAIEELTSFVAKAPDGELKREAIQLLADLKKQSGDTSNTAQTSELVRQVQKEYEPAVPESGYSVIEMRIDSLLTMEVVDTLTDPGQSMLAGVNEFKAGRFDNAVREFKKTIVAYPTSAVSVPCSYDIGVCYMKMRLFNNSDNQFDNVCNRFPNHRLAAQSLFLKAFSYFQRGDMTLAEKLFREFIRKYLQHPWSAKALEKLGDVYEDLKQLTKAMDAYGQAVGQSKDHVDRLYACYKLGVVCFEAGNPERAVASFKKVIDFGEAQRLYVRVPDSYYKIADYQYRKKDYKNALVNYQKAVRKFPAYQETPWGLFQTGNIHKNMRNFQKAAEVYQDLAKKYPDDYWAKQARWKLEDAKWENEYEAVMH